MAQAQSQPHWLNKPLRIIVAFAAGSFTDVAARSIGRELTEQLGQQVIVENRLGAGGTLGTNAAARATEGIASHLRSSAETPDAGGRRPRFDVFRHQAVMIAPRLLREVAGERLLYPQRACPSIPSRAVGCPPDDKSSPARLQTA
jgi:hypothetical protein